MRRRWIAILFYAVIGLAAACALRGCHNSPWPRGAAAENTLFQSYASQIRNLDPAAASYTHESAIVDNIVEAPLAYHYLARPYQLIPQLLTEIPQPHYYDAAGARLPDDAPPSAVARTEYLLRLKPGILYQPHPCFSEAQAAAAMPHSLQDFQPHGTRAVTAEDFRTTLVRLCDPRIASTAFSIFNSFIAGMDECSAAIQTALDKSPALPDYRKMPLAGCELVDDLTLRLTLKRKYPQFVYWLAMHYFAPTPYEALEFYERPEVRAAGLSWANWPVGSGAFMLETAELNSRIVLVRNPNFHGQCYPSEGEAGDAAAGLLNDAGRRLPFLDRAVFNYERETIPNWIKFQQGYYDNSGIPNDMFDNAVAMQPGSGEVTLSAEMAQRGLKMTSTVPPISYYFAFNMLDPLVGGLEPEKCLLRQALSMVIDTHEYITIFKNGNGIVAEGIIPPGLFGEPAPPESYNTVLNDWDDDRSRTKRKTVAAARALMAEAGYAGGIDPAAGGPLVLHLDHASAGLPDFKNRFQWLRARFALLGVELEERPSDLNRSREKLAAGNWQFLFERGWVADYPDPENFLFLFFSGNGHVENRGSNYSNYNSPRYDGVFSQLETMQDSPERLALIRQAEEILAYDCPVVWDYHPVNTILTQSWLHNYKPSGIAYDGLKYLRVDPEARAAAQRSWNRPVLWPVWLLIALITAAAAGKKLRRG